MVTKIRSDLLGDTDSRVEESDVWDDRAINFRIIRLHDSETSHGLGNVAENFVTRWAEAGNDRSRFETANDAKSRRHAIFEDGRSFVLNVKRNMREREVACIGILVFKTHDLNWNSPTDELSAQIKEKSSRSPELDAARH